MPKVAYSEEDRERIFRECRYQVVATDMLAAALPALERANLDADFLEALAELYPTCEAFYFQNCGKLLLPRSLIAIQVALSQRDHHTVPCSGVILFHKLQFHFFFLLLVYSMIEN